MEYNGIRLSVGFFLSEDWSVKCRKSQDIAQRFVRTFQLRCMGRKYKTLLFLHTVNSCLLLYSGFEYCIFPSRRITCLNHSVKKLCSFHIFLSDQTRFYCSLISVHFGNIQIIKTKGMCPLRKNSCLIYFKREDRNTNTNFLSIAV